jgi:hypothetical protein
LSSICAASAEYRSCVYEPIEFGIYERKSSTHHDEPLEFVPLSAGGYHQHMIRLIPRGRRSFITSRGSFLYIILKAICPATMSENSAANAMHIWRIHQNGPCVPVKVASQRNSFV